MDIERDPTHLAAANWFVRLQVPEVSLEDLVAWQAWIDASPENARAFARIEDLSHVLGSVPAPPAVSADELARDGYDGSIPLKEWKPPPT